MEKQRANLFRDIGIILISIIVAIILYKMKFLEGILTSTKEMEFIGSFVAGMFFTSAFTSALATVALAEIAQANSVILTAILGGMGALLGDYIIFRFVKNNLANDIGFLLQQVREKRLVHVFHLRFFRWFIIFLGALVIASPLPDELGLAMLGMSKIKNSLFIPMSLIFNSLGILIIGLIARSLI
ncbi:MAG: hypothetical protein PHN74_03325 [Candidatus Pacebacteria bacterium]|nr:hypothetical protein [Candidatus Paceibacterota bacterium]